MLLLDTNLCIELLRGRAPRARDRLAETARRDVGISAITLAELRHGAARSGRTDHHNESITRLCMPLMVLDFDSTAAQHYGRLRALLEAAGTPIGPMDMLIAAHAVSLRAIVITNNTREFRRVPGLKVENWQHE